MRLDHVTADKCPECGAKAVSWWQGQQHACGDFREKVEFACGEVLEYSPNFSRVEGQEKCQRLRERRERENHARDAAVLESVDWAKCEPRFIADMMVAFDRLKFHYLVVRKGG